MGDIMSIQQRLDRFQSKKWGIFCHFLGGYDAQAWNKRVENVDVELWARQLHELGCGFMGITLMQVTQLMLAPNSAYNRITGYKPGEACAERDFVLDLSDALKKYDIDLMLYFTGDGPCRDSNNIANKAFGFTTTIPVKIDGVWHCEYTPRHVPESFVDKWCEVLEEYALRYGDRVFAWWFDGCYSDFYPDEYREKCMKKYADTVRKGNKDALVTFNGGFDNEKVFKHSIYENFTGGETGELLPPPAERYVDGSQWFEFLCNSFWYAGGDRSTGVWDGTEKLPRFTPEELKDYVEKVNAGGGIVMFDTKFTDDKYIDKEQAYMMSKLIELK